MRRLTPYKVVVKRGPWLSEGIGETRKINKRVFIFGWKVKDLTFRETRSERVYSNGSFVSRVALNKTHLKGC